MIQEVSSEELISLKHILKIALCHDNRDLENVVVLARFVRTSWYFECVSMQT